MKMKWSAILTLALFFTVGCGKEQFGSTPTSTTNQVDAVKTFEKEICNRPTQINPKVDVLYLVDNSQSTYYLANDIKIAIRNMVNSISKDFDYRVIGTGLLATDSTPFNDYQVITNSQDLLSSEAASRRIISASELNFFMSRPVSGVLEAGLRRSVEFINHNISNSSGLFRQNANLLIVVFSNGRDTDIEQTSPYGGAPIFKSSVYTERLNQFSNIKTQLNLTNLRLFAATAHSNCKEGWFSSRESYKKMANQLYNDAGASDASAAKDAYDLCSGISNVFAPVNKSIQEVKVNHTYRFWPIPFANNTQERNDFGEITVYKVNKQNGSSNKVPSSDWEYFANTSGAPLETRVSIPGEPVNSNGKISGKHFIRFKDNALVVSPPNCVIVKSSTRTEYFGYVLLNQEPKPESIVLRINGRNIPKSATDGWSYVGNRLDQNIKMPHPAAGDDLPAVYKSGFMIQLNGANNYYKSGDSVEANFIAAPL